MRAARFNQTTSARMQLLRSLRRQLHRETNLRRRKQDNLRLRHIRMTSIEAWTMLLLVILLLLAMVLGAYRGLNFEGKIIEVGSAPMRCMHDFIRSGKPSALPLTTTKTQS
jgi:hypothetical protein